MLIRFVVVEYNQEKYNVGNLKINNLNVKSYVKRKEVVDNMYAIKFVVNSELLLYYKIINANLLVINY